MEKISVKERRYTRDHEWIDFYEQEAVTGISWFKLIGFKQIQKIVFVQPLTGFRREGETLAVIIGSDYQIAAHMPIDGHITALNEALLSDGRLLLDDPEGAGWIATITPWEISHNQRLMSQDAYNHRYQKLPL